MAEQDVITKGVFAIAGAHSKKDPVPSVKFEDLPEGVAEITRLVSVHFDLPIKELLSKGRGTQYTAKARQVVMWGCHAFLDLSHADIGSKLERDRTSVRHGIEYIDGLLQCDDATSEYLDYLEALFLDWLPEETEDAEDMI